MIIRREEKEDIRVVEELIRDAFWNVYGPGATEHYVAHRLRSHKDFVKELDMALLEGRIDLAVHSLKDMPMEENPEIPVLAYSAREDVRDVLVLPEGKTEIDFSKPSEHLFLHVKHQD